MVRLELRSRSPELGCLRSVHAWLCDGYLLASPLDSGATIDDEAVTLLVRESLPDSVVNVLDDDPVRATRGGRAGRGEEVDEIAGMEVEEEEEAIWVW